MRGRSGGGQGHSVEAADELGAVAAVPDDVQPAFLCGHEDQALWAEGGHDLVGDEIGHTVDVYGLGERGGQVRQVIKRHRTDRFSRWCILAGWDFLLRGGGDVDADAAVAGV